MQNWKIYSLIGIAIFISSVRLLANDLPVDVNDPVYSFLSRLAARGLITGYNEAIKPLSRSEVVEFLNQLAGQEAKLSKIESQILREFVANYRLELTDKKHPDLTKYPEYYFPFQDYSSLKSHVKSIFQYQSGREDKHLFIYEEGKNFIWGDFEGLIRLESKNGETRRIDADRWTIQGAWRNYFSFQLHAARYRRSYNARFSESLHEDRYAWGMFQPNNVYTYDYNYAAMTFSWDWVKIGLYNQPLRIGYTPGISTILSSETPTFPYIGVQAKVKNIRFSYLHADILNDSARYDYLPEATRNRAKYFAIQRVDVPLLREKVWVGYSNIIIYGDRNRELAYLIPINFFWTAGHSQQDRDNLLIALDCRLKIMPNTVFYATLLLDELRLSELGKKWWANKHGLQGAVRWSPAWGSLPLDFIFEFTALRPWIYTHKTLTTNYTHNGFCLGFPYGGNSQTIFFQAGTYFSPRFRLNTSFTSIKQGRDEQGKYYGGDVKISYEWRDPTYDHATKWIMGPVRFTNIWKIESIYKLGNETLLEIDYNHVRTSFKGKDTKDDYLSIGLRVNI